MPKVGSALSAGNKEIGVHTTLGTVVPICTTWRYHIHCLREEWLRTGNRTLFQLEVSQAQKGHGVRPYLSESGPRQCLYQVPITTLGGWHPEAHRAVLSLLAPMASVSMVAGATAGDILFQRHAALLISSNAACLLLGRYVLVWSVNNTTAKDIR